MFDQCCCYFSDEVSLVLSDICVAALRQQQVDLFKASQEEEHCQLSLK